MKMFKISLMLLTFTSPFIIKPAEAGAQGSFQVNPGFSFQGPQNLTDLLYAPEQHAITQIEHLKEAITDRKTFQDRTLSSIIHSYEPLLELIKNHRKPPRLRSLNLVISGEDAQKIMLILDHYSKLVIEIQDSLETTKGMLGSRSVSDEASITKKVTDSLFPLHHIIDSLICQAISNAQRR